QAVSRWVGLPEYRLRCERRPAGAVEDDAKLPVIRQGQQHHPTRLVPHGLQLANHRQRRPCPAVATQVDVPAVGQRARSVLHQQLAGNGTLLGLGNCVVVKLVDPLQLVIQLHIVQGDVHQIVLMPACSNIDSSASSCPVGTATSTAVPRDDSRRITVLGAAGVAACWVAPAGPVAWVGSRRLSRSACSRARRCSDSMLLSMPMACCRSLTAWLLPEPLASASWASSSRRRLSMRRRSMASSLPRTRSSSSRTPSKVLRALSP